MPKARQAATFLLLAALFAAGIFVGIKVPRLFGRGTPQRMFDTPALLKQVQTLSDLVTVKYVIEKAEAWEDPPQPILYAFGDAGFNRILLLAHGVAKAGVDLGQIRAEDIRIQGKTIYINLPAARITDVYLDDNLTQVVEWKTGLLRSFDKNLEQKVRLVAVQDIRSAASHGGILKDADDRARAQLASFFGQMGFEKVEFPLTDSSLPRLNSDQH